MLREFISTSYRLASADRWWELRQYFALIRGLMAPLPDSEFDALIVAINAASSRVPPVPTNGD